MLSPSDDERKTGCPIFDCQHNLVHKLKAFRCDIFDNDPIFAGPFEVVSTAEICECPKFKPVESCTSLLTPKNCIIVDENGTIFTFVTHGKTGVKTMFMTVSPTEIYAIKHSEGQLQKIDFYYDKQLCWIERGQRFLPGMEQEVMKLNA